MSLTINDDFRKGGFDLISCHNPLVLDVTLQNAVATAASGDVTVEIAGSAPTENVTPYNFDMAYVSTSGSGTYDHEFRLDITDIIRKICNAPRLEEEVVAGGYYRPSRLSSKIEITVESAGESDDDFINYYMHGFNQVNDPDGSCLVDFADPDVEAIIPIAPGVPHLFNLWQPDTFGSGTWTTRIVDIATLSMGSTVTKGLYQLRSGTWDAGLISDWPDQVKEYTLTIQDSVAEGVTATIKLVALSLACTGDVVLAWLNRYGCYSYLAFDKWQKESTKQKHIGSYDREINDIADVRSRKLSRGFKEAVTTITAVSKNVPTEYFPAIEDLFYSMDVYMFTGTITEWVHDDADWTRVLVSGNLLERKKGSYENVRVDIMLPEKYTQLR